AGSYEFNPRFGIPEYISHAGGRTRTARELTDVKLIHPSGVVVPYRGDPIVAPGDTIVVPERNFTRPEIAQIVVATATLAVSALWVGYSIRGSNCPPRRGVASSRAWSRSWLRAGGPCWCAPRSGSGLVSDTRWRRRSGT